MDFQLYSKNVIVTDSLREYIGIKMDRLNKFSSHATACHLEIGRDSHHKSGDVFRFEMNISIPKKTLRIEEFHSDARAAIDVAIDNMERQLGREITKRRDRQRRQI